MQTGISRCAVLCGSSLWTFKRIGEEFAVKQRAVTMEVVQAPEVPPSRRAHMVRQVQPHSCQCAEQFVQPRHIGLR